MIADFKKKLPYIFVITLLFVGAVLSILAFNFMQKWESQKLWIDFRRASENRRASLEREIETDLQALIALRAFYLYPKKISRSEFGDFSNVLLSQHPSIQALEWIPRIPYYEREEYENAAKRDGFPDFRITERAAQGNIVKAGKRNEYFPIYYIEPNKEDKNDLGFDLSSDLACKTSLERARDTREMAATGRLRLARKVTGQEGFEYSFLVFAPMYRKSILPGSVQIPRDYLKGFVLGVFRIGEVVEGALAHLESEGIDFYIYDQSAPSEEGFLYFHQSRARNTTISPMSGEEVNLYKGIKYRTILNVSGREWLIVFMPTPEFIATRKTWLPFGVLSMGLLLTGLVASYLWVNIQRMEKLFKAIP